MRICTSAILTLTGLWTSPMAFASDAPSFSSAKTCGEKLDRPALFKKGIHFGPNNYVTEVNGSWFKITDTDNGAVPVNFDVGRPIDGIELVDYPATEGLFSIQKTLAIVRSGSTLITIDLEHETPLIANVIQARARITDLKIGEADYVSRGALPVWKKAPTVEIQIEGLATKTTLLMDTPTLSHYAGPSAFESPQSGGAHVRFDAARFEVLHDLETRQFVRSNDAIFLYDPRTRGTLFIGDVDSGQTVVATHGIRGGEPRAAAVAIGSKISLIDEKALRVESFDFGESIDGLELIELPYAVGMVHLIHALVRHGTKLSILEVGDGPPHPVARIDLKSPIESFTVESPAYYKDSGPEGTLRPKITLGAAVRIVAQGRTVAFHIIEGQLKPIAAEGELPPGVAVTIFERRLSGAE